MSQNMKWIRKMHLIYFDAIDSYPKDIFNLFYISELNFGMDLKDAFNLLYRLIV